tara:strand:+ start:7136 stop:8209 length:1074 start_codon:yes stop_codon:yes gene_type:complete
MALIRADISNLRLFNKHSFSFEPGINLIIGKNGSGKSSILEALNIAYSGRSHRSSRLINCIKEETSGFVVSLLENREGKNIRIDVEKPIAGRVRVKIKEGENKLNKSSISVIPSIINDTSFKLVEGAPEQRRDFLNKIMFHVKPETKKIYNFYIKSLKQRNNLLVSGQKNKELEFWTEKIVEYGVLLGKSQNEVFNIFRISTEESLLKISKDYNLDFLKGITFNYSWGWKKGRSLKGELRNSLFKDIAIGRTSVGPHRADLIFTKNNKLINDFLSRGQVKLLIILVFLSVQKILEEIQGYRNFLMIDDLGSELDEQNLDVAIDLMSKNKRQAILTSTGKDWVNSLNKKSKNINKIFI